MKRVSIVRFFLLAASVLAVAVPSASAYGQLGTINPVGGGPDAANFVLASPGEMRRAPDGSFFVVDSGNSRIVRVSATGQFLYAFGGPTSSNAGTLNPLSIALVPTGGEPDVLVSTQYDVKRFTSTGTFIAKFTPPTPGFLEIDPAWGDLYMSDYQANNVKRIAMGDDSCTGGTTEQFGDVVGTYGQGAGVSDFLVPGKLWGPRSVAFDSTGRLFVVDRNQRRVTVFTRTNHCDAWVHETQFGSNSAGNPANMVGARGITIDRGATPNKIYVTVDFLNHVVLAYTGDPAGNAPFVYHGRWGSALEDSTISPGNGPDDLSAPSGIAVNGSDAWVSETGNDRIHAYTGVSAATPFTVPTSTGLWGHSGREDGYFLKLGQIAAAPDGSVFVLDREKYRVQHFSPRSELIGAWGQQGTNPEDFASMPAGIAVTAGGEVLVPGAGGIKRFNASGSYLGTITWTELSPPSEISPGPMTVDGAGNIWVYDYAGSEVLKLDSSGTILASFGSTGFDANTEAISNPADIAASADGLTVFVLDAGTNLIKKFTSSDGATYTFAGASQASTGAGTAPGRMSGPSSIELDPVSGEIVAADTGNNRVQRFAGSDLSFVSESGAFGMDDQELINPIGLAFDKWGNLWLGDQGNDRIKRFGDAPVVTFAPQPASTTASSTSLDYEVTDPGADCSPATGTSVPLSLGANSFVVTCTNAEGSDVETLSITRTAPPLDPPVVPGPPAAVTLKLPKKFKLAKQLKFSVTCPDGCSVTPKLLIGKKSNRLKAVRVASRPTAQTVKLKLGKSQIKKARAALARGKKVYLSVNVLSYKATQGKSGKASVSK